MIEMKTVKKILERHGIKNPLTDMKTGDHYTVEASGTMDLTIEKIGENRISVAHYYTQMGDLMSDPEIVFRINTHGKWTPIRYTQHPSIHQHDENGLPQIQSFVKQWSRNLKKQGLIQAAQNGGEI